MTLQRNKLIIAGDKAFAQIACEYFTHDSDYDVVAFTVEQQYLGRQELSGLPMVAFEEIERTFPPDSHSLFVALTYAGLNRVRTRLFSEAVAKGYAPVTFVSPHAFVWHNVEVGDNCFIFENNVVQPFAVIGDNCILWSGNHIGHHSRIGDNCFIASHVVVSGYAEIGENSFLGVNATIADGVKVARDNVIGAGALIMKDTAENKVFKGSPAVPSDRKGTDTFPAEG